MELIDYILIQNLFILLENCKRFESSIRKYNIRSLLKNIIEEINISKTMPKNPFHLGWNKGWSFIFFLDGGIPKIEASGFGIAMTTNIRKGESPWQTADRLVLKEQRHRKSIYYSWLKSISKKDII